MLDAKKLNHNSLDKVPQKLKPVIEDMRKTYHQVFGETVKSIYVLGSAVRGDWLETVSDVDTKAFIDRKVTDEDWAKLRELRQATNQKYPFIGFADFEPVELTELPKLSRFQFILAVDGVLLEGKPVELRENFPELGPDLARYLYKGYGKMIVTAKQYIDDEITPRNCRWLAKIGFRFLSGIVLNRTKQFVVNVAEVAQAAKTVLPELTNEIDVLQSSREKPAGSRAEYIKILAIVEKIFDLAVADGISDPI